MIAAGLSLVLPGAGQVYNHQYVKGGLFLLSEVGLSLYAANRYAAGERYTNSISAYDARYRDGVNALSSPAAGLSDSVRDSLAPYLHALKMNADTARYKRDRLRNTAYHSLCWAAGSYVFALLDALEKTGRFTDDRPRNPKVAFWLSTIPGLGLGQIYNGKFSKAGMILMVQAGLALVAYDNHNLLMRAQDELVKLGRAATSTEPASMEYRVAHEVAGNTYISEWQDEYDSAFRNRNTFLWYSLFFYLYGIFDAVVDAHLHDYRHRMQLDPDLRVSMDGGGMRLHMGF